MMRPFINCIKIIAFTSMIFYGCSDADDGLTDATLSGYDLRLCACCGGVLVQLDHNQKDTYQWQQRNENFGIKPTDTFPLKVKIKYHFLANTCVASAGEIQITELIRIK